MHDCPLSEMVFQKNSLYLDLWMKVVEESSGTAARSALPSIARPWRIDRWLSVTYARIELSDGNLNCYIRNLEDVYDLY